MAKKKNYKSMSKKMQKRKVARTNKKLLTLVILIIGFIVAGLSGLWYFVEYRGAERNIIAGDSYFSEGEFKNARKQYGRAVTKEPASLPYVNKLRDATLAIVPVTPTEARSMYDEYVRTLVHEARYNPQDVDSHLRVAKEMYTSAFLTGLDENWLKLRAVAQNGLDQLSLDNPRRHELLLYRGIASLRIEDASMTEAFDDVGNVRFPGESDFEEVLESDPGNAMAWAALAHGRMAVYYRLNDEGKTKQANRNKIFANETMTKALGVAGDSFEVSAIVLREMLLRRTTLLQQKVANQDSVTQEQIDAATKKVVDARNTLARAYDPAIHFARAGEVATLVVNSDEDGREVAATMLRKTIDANPDDFGRKYMLAGILVGIDKEDEAAELAIEVLEEKNQTVGLHAVELFSIRPLFAQFLVQLYIDKTQGVVDEQERLSLITRAKEYREKLYELVSGKEDNQWLLYSDGMIALVEERYADAAKKLEESINRNPNADARAYSVAAFAFSKNNAKGLALEFLQIAIEKEPSNLSNYLAKARIEIQLSNQTAAAKTLSVLPAETLERSDVQELLNLISMGQSGSDKTAFSDPTLRYISNSERLTKSKEFEEAVTLLQKAIDLTPEPDWRLFTAMSNVYSNWGEKEVAIEWLQKAIDVIPDSSTLMPQLHILQSDNRVDALISLVESREGTDAEKAEELAVALYELGINFLGESNRWAQMGNTQDAIDAKEMSTLALEESLKFQDKAESLGADMTRIVVLRFSQAISDDDHDSAELLIEELVEIGALQAEIDASRVSLHLAKATEAKNLGQLDVFESQTSKALTIAEKMVEEGGITDFAWKTLGRVLVEIGEMDEAANAYAEAYRISPRNKETIRRYVAVLAAGNTDSQRLLRVLRTARNQFPNDRQIRTAWLEAEWQFGEPWKVLVYRMNQYVLVPGDRSNALELAYFLTNTTPRRELLRNLEGEEVHPARNWEQMPPRLQAKALQMAKKEWDDIIQKILTEASQQTDPNLRIMMLHASIHRDLGQLDQSSYILDQFIANANGTDSYTTAVIAAADFLHQASRTQQAVTLLENARDAQSERLEIDAVLGSLHYAGGLFKEAAEYMKGPVGVKKDSVLHSRMIESLALSGQFEEAKKSLEEFTTTNSAYAKAMLRALISRVRSEQLLAQGDIDGGTRALKLFRNALREAINADRENQIPYIRLCNSLLSEYRLTQNKPLLEEALQVADEASTNGNESEQFIIVRANVLQADGQLSRSIDRLSRYLAGNPDSSTVRQRLIEAYLDSDNTDRALATAKAGVEVDPTDASWYRRLGDLYIRANDDIEEGVRAYLEAIQRNPSIQLLMRIDEVTRTDQQLPNLELIEMAKGPLSKLHPIVGAIKAKALQNLGRNRDALLAMEQSWRMLQQAIDKGWFPPQAMAGWFLDLHELFKNDPAAGESFVRDLVNGPLSQFQLAGLASYYYSFDDEYVEQALGIINTALNSSESNQDARIQLLMMRGGYLVEAKRYEESESTFRLLAEESNSPLVQNNLAYVIGVYQNRPEEGLLIAKKAVVEAPRTPSVVDTVATMYQRLGQYEQAAKALDFLLQLDPSNSTAMAKLSLLYSEELGEPERGLVFAERGRSQNPRSPEVLDALGWSYYRMGKKEQGEESIQRSLRQGDTMEAYLHLAQIVTEDEEFDSALGHLRMAQELAEDEFSMNRIQVLKDDIRKKKNESQRNE